MIRKQRMAMEEQLETFRATSAAQMKTSEPVSYTHLTLPTT